MATQIRTMSGSVYVIDGDRIKRAGTHDLRGDSQWLRLLIRPSVEVGFGMALVLEPLGEGDCTVRRTSAVAEVREVELA